jgi:hypothetical protein
MVPKFAFSKWLNAHRYAVAYTAKLVSQSLLRWASRGASRWGSAG